MKTSLLLAGGILLTVGLIVAIGADYNKEHMKGSERFSLAGLVIAAIGLIVQTVANLLP